MFSGLARFQVSLALVAFLLSHLCSVAPARAALSAEQRRCQTTVARRGMKFVAIKARALAACHDKMSRGRLPAMTDCAVESATWERINAAEQKLRERILSRCPDDVVASLIFGGSCFGVETGAELADCIAASHEAKVDEVMAVLYATDSEITSRAERQCQANASGVSRKYLRERLRALARCKDRVAKGRLALGTDCSAEPRAAARIQASRERALNRIGARCEEAMPAFGTPCADRGSADSLALCLVSVVEAASGKLILAEYGVGPGGGTALAKRITDPGECVGGPLSRCRVGDYLLENDKIRVVIQDVQRNLFGIGQFGGQIIDADRQRGGAPEIDNFEEWSTSINVENTAHYTDIVIVNDGSDGQPAIIRATGPDDLLDFLNPSSIVASFGFSLPASADDVDLPVEISTDYALEPGQNYVRVETRVQNTDPLESVEMFFGEFLNGSGQVEIFQPGYGFGEPLITDRCPETATNPCNVVAYRGVDEAAGVSYGYVHEVPGTTTFTTSGVTVPQLGTEILLALVGVSAPNFVLAPQGTPGDRVSFTRYFVVGDGTVASILDARNRLQSIPTGILQGTVQTASGGPAAGVEIAVLGDPVEGPSSLGALERNVVNHTVTDASGQYWLSLPPGDYEVVANLEGHPFQGGGPLPAANPVTITAFDTTVLDITLPDAGFLQVNVTDGVLNPLPAKVSVVGFDPSQDPLNTQTIFGLINNTTGVFRDRFEDGLAFGLAQVLFVDPSGISDVIPIEPGTYEVVASRGPEYSIDAMPVTVVANDTVTVDAKLGRVVDTSGFVSADFHVHSIQSPDSEVTRIERIVSMMAEGLEFFTPSDHDFRGDFQPLVVARGWQTLVATAPNNEITTFDYGHFNAWPMTVDPNLVNGGSVDHGGAAPAGEDFPSHGNFSLTPGEILAEAASDPGINTVQINHIHSHFGLQGGTGLAIDTGREPPRSAVPAAARRLDPAMEDPAVGFFSDAFDAVEVWIGDSRGQIFENFLGRNAGDWFNLLNQGILRTGVADSDTHRRILSQAGIPRTLVASATEDLDLLDPEALSAAVNAGKAIGTNSPMVRVTVEALASGERASLEEGEPVLVSAADGKVEVAVDVQSAAWAEFDTIEFYLNSTTTKTVIPNVETGAGPVDVTRYGIVPDFVQVKGTDFVVSQIQVDPSVPGGTRLEASTTLRLDGVANPALTEDTWIVVVVKGSDGVSRPLFPVIPNNLDAAANSTLDDLTDGNLGEDGILALAFTNPLFVDVNDGAAGPPDGDFDPPGVHFASPGGAFVGGIRGLLY